MKMAHWLIIGCIRFVSAITIVMSLYFIYLCETTYIILNVYLLILNSKYVTWKFYCKLFVYVKKKTKYMINIPKLLCFWIKGTYTDSS